MRAIWENIKSLAGAVLIYLVIKTFLMEAFRIPSGSMIPTLMVGDWLFVNKIAYGAVQNAAGEFVRASTETVSNAAAVATKNMPKDFRVSITNAPGKDVYPISSFTWLLLQEAPSDVQRSKTMVDFVRWAITDGQKFAPELGYAPLPREVVALELEALKRVRQ